ncbi:helix-turn-helix transcriptional regulator [Stenotrophomonas sp. ISL-67]|uniref:helix-turn-helix domain-containing protein n=1 Tax=Stenotrophomonas sp. ISL-67 TaxID=2819171 RepID=UPI001BE66059|nr:AraC family transcriptional regulator [Stenotrophomonas sp. ISL-67]MBT2767642.1 helix-turn-helix transcriptional regulator [Stenotrophomonas sp. ISL-67]
MKIHDPIHRRDRRHLIPAHRMPDYFPAEARLLTGHHLDSDVQVQIFRHRNTTRSLTIPAVAEPLLVLVVSGAALVEERVDDQEWMAYAVAADDFFLTTSQVPYEMRWHSDSGDDFQVMHVYLSQRLLDLAARDAAVGERAFRLKEVSGGRDPEIAGLMRLLFGEMTPDRRASASASAMYLQGIGQALAVHLVRRYREETGFPRQPHALPVYKLHQAIEAMRNNLDREFNLTRLATDAGMSLSHFSRTFRKATGVAPSQYFIHLRMETARQLLLGSDSSILSIALDVGYNNPSHFTHVFKRHVGVTPREYRENS